jgi:hypothetical protein
MPRTLASIVLLESGRDKTEVHILTYLIAQKAKKCSPVYLDYLDTIRPTQFPLKSLSSGLKALVGHTALFTNLESASEMGVVFPTI